MFNFVYHMPDILLFLLINGVTITISLLAIYLLEKIYPAKERYKENQGIGYISATICVIFAVLSGFAALYVLTNFNRAGEVAQQEANLTMAIYQDAGWVGDPLREHLKGAVKEYFKLAVEHDWPLMSEGKEVDIETDLLLNQIAKHLHRHTQEPDPPFALQEISKEIIALRDARAERIRLSQSALGPDIWLVILLCAFVTIAINYAFGMQYYLHLVLASAAALVVSSMIFLLIVLDHPFQGKYSINAGAFQYYLTLISDESSPNSTP